MSGWEIALGAAALALGGALHGSMGFGLRLVAGPLLQFGMQLLEPYSRLEGVEHSIRNTSPTPSVFVEVEYL